MAEEALRMSHIVKIYPNGVMANKDVTLSVNLGEIHALSGENGAGKSTLMKILFGEEQPTSGEIYVNGKQVHMSSPQMAIKMGIGMVHQHFMLVSSLTVAENIILGMEPRKGVMVDLAFARKQVEEMGRKYNLYVDPDKRVEDLTVGQKQKVEILKALFRGARILILDEPTNGLDPSGIVEMRAFLQGLNRDKGITIVVSSHHLAELEQMATMYAFLKRGRVMEQVSARTLQERCSDYVDIAVSEAARFAALLEKELHHERYLVLPDDAVRIFDPAAGIEAYSGLAARAGMDVLKLERGKMSLEQYYLDLKEKGAA